MSPVAQARRRWGLAFAIVGAIAFSGKAILAKLMYRHGVDAVMVLFWRMAFALPFFLVMARHAGRGKPPLDGRDLRQILLLGFFGYYLASYLDFLGLQYVSASLERLILYLNPTLVLLIGWFWHGRKVGRGQIIALVVSYLGVVLAFAHEVRFDGLRTAIGGALVFGSALSYAIYLSGSQAAVQRLGSLRLVGWASSVACLLCIVQGFVLKTPAELGATPGPVLGWSMLNATVCTVVPMLLVMMGIERLGSTTAAQVGMVGPVSTVLMGVWVLGEPFTLWMALGTGLVMTGVALLVRLR